MVGRNSATWQEPHMATPKRAHKMAKVLARAVGGLVGGAVREVGIKLALMALCYMVCPASHLINYDS